MDIGVQGKRYLIGGGSKGLGFAIAQELVNEGAKVLLMSREEENLKAAVSRLGANASSIAIDIADHGAIEKISAAVDRELGGLDGLLVNAGGPPPGETLALSDTQWLGAFELLIGGPIRLIRALEPKMSDGSAILFITSSSVRQPIANLDTSNVLRPGVTALGKVLARELAPRIRVNTMGPGRFNTDRMRSLDAARSEKTGVPVEKLIEESVSTIPMGRYGEPEEFGRIGAFLLSPAASYISGQSLMIDGAMVTALP